jgi:hypothetical protein
VKINESRAKTFSSAKALTRITKLENRWKKKFLFIIEKQNRANRLQV